MKEAGGARFLFSCYEKTGEKTTKKSVSFGKINKMLLIEIPIAMISLLIFIMVFQAKFSVKSVVERYAEGMGDGNWNQVYDTLYLNDFRRLYVKAGICYFPDYQWNKMG